MVFLILDERVRLKVPGDTSQVHMEKIRDLLVHNVVCNVSVLSLLIRV